MGCEYVDKHDLSDPDALFARMELPRSNKRATLAHQEAIEPSVSPPSFSRVIPLYVIEILEERCRWLADIHGVSEMQGGRR